MPYVSGLKTREGTKCFAINVQGKTMLDIGSSTGGFTDVAFTKWGSFELRFRCWL